MNGSQPPHVEGTFHLFASAQGGRTAPVESGYRPQHKVHDNYLSTGRHEYPDVEQVAPGDSVKVHAWFVTPEMYPGSLWAGRQVAVMEGRNVVGMLTVTRILNDVLAGSKDSYSPVWTKPAGSADEKPAASYLAIFAVSCLYLLLAGTALVWTIDVSTPCVSNFEGGCGMGKALLGFALLVPAAMAACMAFVIKNGLASIPKTAPHANVVGIVLGGVPIACIVITLKAFFYG